jgi:hypothetical protein
MARILIWTYFVFYSRIFIHRRPSRRRSHHRTRGEQTSVVELVAPEDVLAKMTYAIANPVSSHLVEKVHHWPGVESLSAIEKDVPLTASKPARFFDHDNDELPHVVQLQFRRAPAFESLSQAEYARLVRDSIQRAEADAAGVNAVKIQLACARTGANKRLRYAFTGTPMNPSGAETGARGNLRDSDTTVSRYF